MSLRITQGNLYQRALQDIQGSLFRYSRLQAQIASGQRVNRPSDDPAAALRIIPLANDLRNLDRMGENGTLAQDVMNVGAAAMEDASSAMQRARELVMQASNGTLSHSDRQAIGAEVDQLLRQLVGIGNSKRGDRYLFGGSADNAAPFRLVEDAGGSRVLYVGNQDRLSVEVAPGIEAEMNLPGDRAFVARQRRAATFSGGTGARPTGAGDTGVGFQTLRVRFNGLHTDAPSTISAGTGSTDALGRLDYAFTTSPPGLSIGGGPVVAVPATNAAFATADGRTINLTVTGVPGTLTGSFTSKASLSTDGGATAVDVADFTAANVAVRNSHDGSVLNVNVAGVARTGDEEVTHPGTFDAFTVLIALRDELRNAAGRPDGTVRDRIAGLLDEVAGAHDAVLDGLRELGFRSSSMDVLKGRVQNLQLSSAESLSQVRDTDMVEAILALQRQDLSYQAALQVSSRMMQTTLAGLLR